ncbi:MAG: hypothetical protein ACKO0W_01710 [Planctomycetota bacterium]
MTALRAMMAGLVLALASGAAAALQESAATLGALRASVTVERNEVEVGEEIVYRVRLEGEGAGRARPARPGEGDQLGDFDLLGFARGDSGAGAPEWIIRLSTLESGELAPPPLAFTEVPGADGGRAELALPPVVVRSLVGDDPDPAAFRDIRGEVALPMTLAQQVGVGLLALAFLATTALLAYLILRRKPAPPVAPDAWALDELARLESAGLPRRREFGRYYDALTATVRSYVARRYGIPADRQTTREFLAVATEEHRLPASERETLRDLLRLADLVKFARAEPDESECALHLAEARAFVERTRPLPESAADAPVAEEVAR